MNYNNIKGKNINILAMQILSPDGEPLKLQM